MLSSGCWKRMRGNLVSMDVQFTPDQLALVERGIETGRFRGGRDVMAEALSQWEVRERDRSSILTAVDEAEAQLSRSEGRPVTPESVRELAAEVNRRGRERLATEQRVIG